MTDDEAFIRAIVDAPGDDLPRLVYADWLDDRDDPRGPHLRAEREAVETGDVAHLRVLAVRLDPVWVARVSMPPVGVCIAGAEISDRGPPVTTADIAAAKRRLGMTLPADYVAFLLNYNGGVLRRIWGEVNGETIYSDRDLILYPLFPEPLTENPHSLDSQAARHRARVDDPASYNSGNRSALVAEEFRRYTPIGHTPGNTVLLGVRERAIGRVNLFHSINSLPGNLADYLGAAGRWPQVSTFAEFLAWFLWPPPPPRPPQHNLPVFDDIPF